MMKHQSILNRRKLPGKQETIFPFLLPCKYEQPLSRFPEKLEREKPSFTDIHGRDPGSKYRKKAILT